MKDKSLFKSLFLLVLPLLGALLFIPASNASGDLSAVKVCLDPGHGGSDPGAVYVNEEFTLHESDINLDVAFGLKSLLEDEGAEVVMTREDDRPKTNSERYTFCNEQGATILVSVHTNSVADPTWDGSMTLYAPSRDSDLAWAIQDVMYKFLLTGAPDAEAFTDFEVGKFASGVLFKCNMPAAMIEPLFMSNPAEAKLLFQSIYDEPVTGNFSAGCEELDCRRGEIAQAVYWGILNYYEDESTPTMHVSSIDLSSKQRRDTFFITSQVVIQDIASNPVPGASVAHTFTLPDGSKLTDTGITEDNGMVTFKLRSGLAGPYESAVTSISKSGWVYYPASNLKTSEILTVP
jgi:N-acetylmuramoyl-L-alanine amidase